MSTSLFSNMPYRVADINQAKKGREEISWVEREMPGLMAIRKEYKGKNPLKGMRISGSSHITTHTAVFIETLVELGAQVNWCASNIYSTQDNAAAAMAAKGISLYAWKGASLADYWWTIFQTLHFNSHLGPTHIIDDKGDLAIMLHQGIQGELDSKILDYKSETKSKQELNLFLKRVLAEDQNCWKNITKHIKAITEGSKTGINRILNIYQNKTLRFPVIDINSSNLKTEIDNFYSSKETIAEALKKATRTMLIGKDVVICGFGKIGEGCAEALKANGSRVAITEVDPVKALKAAMQGYKVVDLDEVCTTADIFITATGKKHIITLDHLQKMKDQAIVCNMGHYELEIEYHLLSQHKDIKEVPISSQLTRYYFPDGHSILLVAEAKLLNLTCDTTQLAFIKSCSYTVQTLVQLQLVNTKLNNKLYPVPHAIDQKVAFLHLNKIGAKLTKTHNSNK